MILVKNIVVAAFLCLVACGCDSSATSDRKPRVLPDDYPLGEPVIQEMKLHALDSPPPAKMTLYSLEGSYEPGDISAPKLPASTEFFHGYPVVGKTDITDADRRLKLWNALNKSIQQSDGKPRSCFLPGHALRIEHDGVQTDYVICFMCRQVHISSGNVGEGLTITPTALTEFDQALIDAGVPF